MKSDDNVKQLILDAFMYGALTARRSALMSDEYLKKEAEECANKLMNS